LKTAVTLQLSLNDTPSESLCRRNFGKVELFFVGKRIVWVVAGSDAFTFFRDVPIWQAGIWVCQRGGKMGLLRIRGFERSVGNGIAIRGHRVRVVILEDSVRRRLNVVLGRS